MRGRSERAHSIMHAINTASRGVGTAAEAQAFLAANPDIADKIRSGKVAAAGKIVGDVMKATRGQADPARVKELVIAACS